MINREDMLELTRRMTPARHCFDRVAGAYMDGEGWIDGTFNIHFGKLNAAETKRNLDLARAVPFARTNRQLKEHPVPGKTRQAGAMWQLLMALRECGLKNDALLYSFYEQLAENLEIGPQLKDGYAVLFFHGCYDIPLKGTDQERLWESEEVYDFLICVLSPVRGEYEAGEPVWGFLYPAFSNRSTDLNHINVFDEDPENPNALGRMLF